jgi:hypothetical protein
MTAGSLALLLIRQRDFDSSGHQGDPAPAERAPTRVSTAAG